MLTYYPTASTLSHNEPVQALWTIKHPFHRSNGSVSWWCNHVRGLLIFWTCWLWETAVGFSCNFICVPWPLCLFASLCLFIYFPADWGFLDVHLCHPSVPLSFSLSDVGFIQYYGFSEARRQASCLRGIEQKTEGICSASHWHPAMNGELRMDEWFFTSLKV